MRVDTCTEDKERFDYARILLATSSLNIIHADVDILVDDKLLNIKIVEEWGFSIGEDVYLFEDDSVFDGSDITNEHCDHVVDNDADILANEIAADFLEKESLKKNSTEPQNILEEDSVVQPSINDAHLHSKIVDDITCASVNYCYSEDNDSAKASVMHRDLEVLIASKGAANLKQVVINDDASIDSSSNVAAHALLSKRDGRNGEQRKSGNRTNSCPLGIAALRRRDRGVWNG
jgi:hypothetical protein